ncbi:MAG: hypothetical protein ACI8QS_001679 [Planctomycetota bacterium]|jgi:hypothetical protein
MAGGYHGSTDPSGNVQVVGWEACGFDSTTEPTPGRTWDELKPK